jgi:glycolate oxidase iron-sulfur subunit
LSYQLSKETSRCVKCGLCLPECPTYQLTQNEACSPRGRIALAAALEQQQIPPDSQFRQRINSCLLCRRCEKLCPSGVKFGRIMDETRALQNENQFGWQLLLNNTISKPEKLRRTLSRVQWLRPFISQIPALAPAIDLADYYPANGAREGAVGLFRGCSGEAIEPHTLQAAVKLLNHACQDVHIPLEQGCCGALHAHAGDKQKAAELRATNIRVFTAQRFDTLVSIASGCGAYLADDEQLPVSHLDICAFLAQPTIIERLHFNPLKAVAAIQIPFSLENVLDSGQAVVDLLLKIPGLELQVLSRGGCCGAAGTYFITHSKTARKLRQPFISQIEQISPDYLLSSNIGCAQHLANGLGGVGNEPPQIMHPASLLAQQLIE